MTRLGFRRSLSAALVSALIVLSPGLAPYEAVAVEFSEGSTPGLTPGQTPVVPKSLELPAPLTINADAGAVDLVKTQQTDLGEALQNRTAAVGQTVQVQTAPELAAQTRTAETSVQQTAKAVKTLSASVHQKLNAADLKRADAAGSRDVVDQVQAELTGERILASGGSLSPTDSVVRQPDAMTGGQGYLARPAGQEISDSARAMFKPRSPAPPSNNNGGDGSGGGSNDGSSGGGERIPIIPRVITSLFAAAPIVLAWPLIASGSLLVGGLVAAASLGVAAMPWMSASTAKAVRSAPGVLIVGLGLATIVAGVPALAGWTIASGAVTALGGWGMIRFARDPKKWEYRSSGELIATFFGSFAAVGGAALAVAYPPAGLIVVGSRVLATGFTLPLLAQLPGWIGETIAAPVHGAYVTFRDSFRVFGAIRRDTVWFKKLSAYTEAAVKKPWNVVWLGLVVWLPILAVEAVWQAIGAVWALALTAARAVPMALWGMSHGLSRESKAAQYFGAWNDVLFSVQKVKVLNPVESKLTPFANGPSRLKSFLAVSAIRIMQLLWVPVSGVLTIGALIAGPFLALKALKNPVPEGGVSPDSLRLETDPLPGKVPSVETPKTVASTPGKLLATAIALVPALLIGLPLVIGGSGLFALVLAPMYLSIALMPLMPESDRIPAWLRTVPASTLKIAGFFAALGAARYFFTGLPVGPVLVMGLVAFGAGIGLARLIAKLQDKETKSWQLEDAQYIGGFVSAIGTSMALGIALQGLGGALFGTLMIAGGISSVFLLAFLPAAFWRGVGAALIGIPSGIRPVHKVVGYWGESDSFWRSLKDWFRFYTRKNGWNAIYFIVPWGAAALLMIAQAATSTVFGLAAGAIRAPINFAWSASYYSESPRKKWLGRDGKVTRFFSGLARFWQSWSTGKDSQEKVFGFLTGWLRGALAEKSAATSRPTLKATLALLLALVLKAVWLVYAAAALALGWIPAIVAGFLNARGGKTKDPNGADPDRPSDRIGIFGL